VHNQLDFLYEQIKKGEINQAEAIKQIKEFQSHQQRNVSLSSNEHNTAYSTTSIDSNGLLEKVEYALLQVVSHILKVRSEDIDADVELNEYGFDQVRWSEFTNRLNQEYRLEMTFGIVEEHPTIHSLAEYLIAEYQDTFKKQFSIEDIKNHPPVEKKKAIRVVEENLLRGKVIEYLKQNLSSVIKLPAHRIEADAPMEKYGIDSIMVMQLTNQLEKAFGSLPKTLFFEYQSIQELTEYFLESYRDKLIELLGIEEKAIATTETPDENVKKVSVKSGIRIRRRPRFAVLQRDVREEKKEEGLDIAIIGVSGRYPGATNIQEFWRNLRDGKDCITEIPKDRWDHSLYYDEDKNKAGKTYSKWGGFLDGVDQFDPLFFNISPREAEMMDPQERLFLECVFATLEDAGYTREVLRQYKGFGLDGNVGVYVGVMYEEYQLYGAQQTIQGRPIALAGNPSSIANRVSYFCNFHGPSMAVDTMCSSSLTAMHLACQSLERGECEIAIAGGVNVSIHPNKYLLLGQGKFVSSKGRCESFGEGGDGYVPGEGVGAVLLKPLSKAIADGDHIYGIIKGTAINHGGKTNGYTVPNPNAQSGVIRQAFKESGIHPRTISYVEAHGTGTSLGDPIEVAGLNKSFQEYTTDKQFCAIGSAKSNIGHCESAAGIAGITKILLQLKYHQLVPSLHSKAQNPGIDFSNTPFIVQQELTEWKRPVVDGQEFPRRAGISSFGAGGSNAHILIEEYISEGEKQPLILINNQNPAIIVLSAKNEEQLKEQVQRLLVAIQEEELSDLNLADMSYTLQVGREAMEERLAVIVESITELVEKLKGFIKGQDDVKGLYRGQVKPNKEALAVFAADEDMVMTIQAWIDKRKFVKLLDLWVKGLIFDWNKLYRERKPYRISLPAYPFSKKRYWVPEIKTQSVSSIAKKLEGVAMLHPLLHQNTSDLSEQRFSSTFTGHESFFENHVVKGQRILSGIAYLEMARAAVEQAAGFWRGENTGILLKNMIWTRPIVVGEQPVQVHIGLFPKDSSEITYEIYSQSEAADAECEICSQGSIMLSTVAEVTILDIEALQAECSQNVLSSTQCYEAFEKMGISYGSGHQGIKKVYVGSGQVLAKLALPSSVSDTKKQFVLHPSLIDSALQASIGFMFGTNDPKLIWPTALQELEIIEDCTSLMWALLRYSDDSKGEDSIQKLDIDLCDEQGKVCVRMKGMEMQESTEVVFKTSAEAKPQNDQNTTRQEAFEIMTFEESWQEKALSNSAPFQIRTMVCFLSNPKNQQAIVEAMQMFDQQTKVVFISQSTTYQRQSQGIYSLSRSEPKTYEQVFQSIRENYGDVDAMLYLWPIEDPNCIQDYSAIVYILQSIAAVKLKTKRVLLGAQFENGLERCYLDSWIGFERSLGLVLPNTQVAVIYQDISEQNREAPMKDWMKKIWAELQTKKIQSVLYQEGKRHVYQIQPTTIQTGDSLLKAGGTYLITGGCGGLGLLFAKHFAETQPVNLILTGRSPIDEEKQGKMRELEKLGSQVLYLQADACNVTSMKAALAQAKEHFGEIHGVVHAAGLAGSQSIFEKDMQSFEKILEPKIKGTIVLDEVLQEEALHFVCYFSSSSAILGDFGSCDYAIGNRFQMAYAHYRNEEQSQGQRQGKTIVINWPLWKDGGMGVGEEENSKMYLKSSGQRFLEAEEGVSMFDRLLVSSNTQHLVLVGERSRVYRFLGLMQDEPSMSSPIISSSSGKGRRVEMKGLSLEQCLEWDLKEHTSQLLKIPRDKLDREENLADFGFDSVSLAQFANLLTNHFGIEITPSLFFGYSTIEKLTQYFLAEYEEAMQLFYQETMVVAEITQRDLPVTLTPKRQEFRKSRIVMGNTPQSMQEPIAIIGMSGRFPQARNIDEMWQILADGKDVVEEFPEERLSNKNVGKTKYKCGCIPGVSEFDPLFFEISPREAESMDPRQRLLLQESWRALEDAGYGAAHIKSSKIGMFVGVEEGDYKSLIKNEGSITSNHTAVLASRLAYFLNLSGPVMAINTACSSGLVATHQACSSLRNQECDTAVAAGVNLMLTLESHVGMSQAGMLSEDGKCFAFDKRANGMVPGEAVAVVVLKRLSQAEVDGDPIYAIIQGSGINYDGKTNGITAPSGVAQTKLLKSIYNQYKIKPEEIEYVVTHGTGTKLGDPIEINALYDVFKDYTKRQGYCALTSTKTNFGHCLAASGLVSLISLVQAFQHEIIPGSLNCDQENDYIHWQESPFYVNKASKPWPQREGKSRLGAVSAFGMSGTNSHIVLQSYSKKEIDGTQAPYYLLAFSAKTQDALEQKIKDIMNGLHNKNWQGQSLSQISYTLQEGRQHFNHRCAIVIQDREDAIHVLKQVGRGEKLPNLFQGTVCRGFTGQKAIAEYAQELLKQGQSMKANEKKYQEILYAIADFYCQGYEIPWGLLYGESKPGRIHLPSYPFAKEHYWVSKNNNSAELNISNGSKLITGGGANSRSQLNKEVSLDVVLKQVYEGILDIKQANQLLQQFYLNEEIK
jgi:acyl transferase domain-containing protein/acyl carrier protein